MERTWMKKCCGLCPFASDGTLFLRPERAAEFADMATNRFNDFPCHKTADLHEDEDGFEHFVHGGKSLTCHGFLTLQSEENYGERGMPPKGFNPDGKGFTDWFEMVNAHEQYHEETKSPQP